MITNSYLQKKKTPSAVIKQKLPEKSFPLMHKSQLSLLSFSKKSNNSNHSEPLNSFSQNLTFKGSFFGKKPPSNSKLIKITEALKRFEKEFGKSASDYLKQTIDEVSKESSKTGIKKEGDILKITPETSGKKIKDIVLYPVAKFPLDFANGFVDTLKKIPGVKDAKFVDDWSKSKILKDRKKEIRITSEAAAVERFFKEASENKDFKAFKDAHSRIKPFVSNYSTTLERAVTRFVTGLIPAFFLANDAYNLSMYMNNKKDVAKKEKDRRFKQEMARILITTATTFGVLSFFAKKSNASQATTTLLLSGVVFVSEFLGRMMAGNPVLPLDKNSAKKYAQKRRDSYNEDKKVDKKPSDTFKGNESKPKNYTHPPEKGALTLENALKVIGGLILFGFAVEKIKGIESVSKTLDKWTKKYDSQFQEKVTIKREKFDKLINKLDNNGYKELASAYKNIIKDQKGDTINLGEQTIKWKNMAVNDFLLFPVKFAWKSIIMMPWKVTKTAGKAIQNAFDGKVSAKKPKEEKQIVLLRNSIDFLKKIDDKDEKTYKKELNRSLLSGLDNVTKSNYSNADLATTTKTAVSGVTSGFLVFDSYNLVMIDSQGDDTELAAQKAKERTIQRGFRIAYGVFLQTLFNNAFRRTYDGSMLGAQLVNVASTSTTEVMERTSVGLPLGESTRDNIIETEKRNLSAKGITGAYYRTMAKLTGKKCLSERTA